jgi:hypothetical protein
MADLDEDESDDDWAGGAESDEASPRAAFDGAELIVTRAPRAPRAPRGQLEDAAVQEEQILSFSQYDYGREAPDLTKRQSPESICSVCTETFTNRKEASIGIVRLPCGHMICRSCFYSIVLVRRSIGHGFGAETFHMQNFVCPFCREVFDMLDCRNADDLGDGTFQFKQKILL